MARYVDQKHVSVLKQILVGLCDLANSEVGSDSLAEVNLQVLNRKAGWIHHVHTMHVSN
jgi:hypothetical protein